MFQKYIKYIRITSQGIAIASFGTMGMNPTWGGFVVGISMFIIAFALVAIEKEE